MQIRRKPVSKGGGGGGQFYPMPTIQSSNSNQSSSTTIPQWLTNASQFGVTNAQNLVNQGTPAYTGELAPGMNGTQNAAGGLIANSIGAYQPYYNAAGSAINNSMTQLNPQTLANGLSGISQYMNPYINNVVNAAQAQGDYALRNNLNTLRDQAINNGAAYGSRQGVQEGAAAENAAYDTQQYIANALNQGYGQAANMLGTDVAAQNQAAQQNNANALAGGQAMSNLGTANRAANTADINNLLQFGNLQQQTQAAQDQANYANYQYQNQQPLALQQLYNQTVSSAPHDTSSTGSSSTSSIGYAPQQSTYGSPLMQGLGGLMAGSSIGNSLFSAPAGGTSAATGLFNALKTGAGLLSFA
jgi:hypothetical protein